MTRVTSQWTQPNEFRMVSTQWPINENVKLTGLQIQHNDQIGTAVAISGDGTIAVTSGIYYGSNPALGDPGGLIVAAIDETDNWAVVSELFANTEDPVYNFGRSVAISGDGATILVGSDNYQGSNNGAIQFFMRPSPSEWNWTPSSFFQADETNGVFFGNAVAVSRDGNYAVSATTSGQLYIYRRVSDAWELAQKIDDASVVQDGNYGDSVAMSGNGDYIVVGAPFQTAPGGAPGLHNGCLYVYKRTDGTWTRTNILSDDIGQESQLGISVAISDGGDVILAGANNYVTNIVGSTASRGAAIFFTRNVDTWSRSTIVTPPPTVDPTDMGRSVALNSDGSIGFVGAPLFKGTVFAEGKVFTYGKSGNTWVYKTEYFRESGLAERMGFSVAASGTGRQAIFGAISSLVTGIMSGAAYIYA